MVLRFSGPYVFEQFRGIPQPMGNTNIDGVPLNSMEAERTFSIPRSSFESNPRKFLSCEYFRMRFARGFNNPSCVPKITRHRLIHQAEGQFFVGSARKSDVRLPDQIGQFAC
jgi:hypothetical protein